MQALHLRSTVLPRGVLALLVAEIAQGITIAHEDAAANLVEFTSGQPVAGIKLSALGDSRTPMMIPSAHRGTTADAAALAMDSVLLACWEVKVEYRKRNDSSDDRARLSRSGHH
jgi:hypothetical protein